MHLNTDFITVK